jgi:Mn-dependent DtxR family transcriptional regulator
MKFANLKVQRLQEEKHSFQLPNGATLRIKHPQDTGSQSAWWRTYTSFQTKSKNSMPILGGLSSGTDMHMLFVDFDFIPKKFKTWDELRDFCNEIPGVCVSESFSGKVKLCLIIKFVGEKSIPDFELLPHIINDILPIELRDTYDKKGIVSTYLAVKLANDLHEFLQNPMFYTVRADTYSNIVLEANEVTETINYIRNENIPDNEFVGNTNGKADRLRFMQVIGAMHGLVKKGGFGLSQRSLATYLGVSQATVSQWLKRLVSMGWLKPVSNSYIVGLKAKHYTAHGELQNIIRDHKNATKFVKVLPQMAPTEGNYYKFLLSLSRRCRTWAEFKLALSHVNDIDKKGRLRMAYAIRRCDERKSRRIATNENQQVQ